MQFSKNKKIERCKNFKIFPNKLLLVHGLLHRLAGLIASEPVSAEVEDARLAVGRTDFMANLMSVAFWSEFNF